MSKAAKRAILAAALATVGFVIVLSLAGAVAAAPATSAAPGSSAAPGPVVRDVVAGRRHRRTRRLRARLRLGHPAARRHQQRPYLHAVRRPAEDRRRPLDRREPRHLGGHPAVAARRAGRRQESQDVQRRPRREGLLRPGRRPRRLHRDPSQHRQVVGPQQDRDRRRPDERRAAVVRLAEHQRPRHVAAELAGAARRPGPAGQPEARRHRQDHRLQAWCDTAGQARGAAELAAELDRAGPRRDRRRPDRRAVPQAGDGPRRHLDRHGRHAQRRLRGRPALAPGRAGRRRQPGHPQPRPPRPALDG